MKSKNQYVTNKNTEIKDDEEKLSPLKNSPVNYDAFESFERSKNYVGLNKNAVSNTPKNSGINFVSQRNNAAVLKTSLSMSSKNNSESLLNTINPKTIKFTEKFHLDQDNHSSQSIPQNHIGIHTHHASMFSKHQMNNSEDANALAIAISDVKFDETMTNTENSELNNFHTAHKHNRTSTEYNNKYNNCLSPNKGHKSIKLMRLNELQESQKKSMVSESINN